MRIIAGIGLLSVAVGALYFFASPKPANVYAMPMQEAYARLVGVDFGTMSEGERALDTTKSSRGNGVSKVTWIHSGDMAHRECDLDLRPWDKDAAQTQVTVTCKGGGAGEGAAAGMAHNLFRNGIIERVDATLTGRPFDKDLARGATAHRWPGDGVDGTLATASGKALKMDAEMRQMRNETSSRREEKPGWEKAEW